VEASVTVRAGKASYPVNSINRIPGIVQDCGRPGATPTAQPRQDITCFESSELVLFTSEFGAATPSGSGTQAGGSVIQGVGTAAARLSAHAITGHAFYAWAETRQPRTIAGIDRQGRLILVTVDGHQPGVSEGATLSEEAALMESLGAVDAMNLDGGSTAMAVDGKLVNHTSDATGECPDGDFVVVLPPRSSRVAGAEDDRAEEQGPERPQGQDAEALPRGQRQGTQVRRGLDVQPGGHRADLLQMLLPGAIGDRADDDREQVQQTEDRPDRHRRVAEGGPYAEAEQRD
jgi:phosphodiester glycosidase